MIVMLILLWCRMPIVPDNVVVVSKYRQLWICPPNAPVHIGLGVRWFFDGKFVFYKPIEFEFNYDTRVN